MDSEKKCCGECSCGNDEDKVMDILTKAIGCEDAPMGVSAWRRHGEKYGYWEYFKKEMK